jgi:hypothetical protein
MGGFSAGGKIFLPSLFSIRYVESNGTDFMTFLATAREGYKNYHHLSLTLVQPQFAVTRFGAEVSKWQGCQNLNGPKVKVGFRLASAVRKRQLLALALAVYDWRRSSSGG